LSHWIDCEIGQRYTVLSSHDGVPIEPERGGQTGQCIGVREGSFGRKWAELLFDDGGQKFIRTLHLVRTNDSSNEASTPDD
jgi:hypothetical protein